MERRNFLRVTGGLSAYLIVGSSLLSIGKAEADTGLPIAALQASIKLAFNNLLDSHKITQLAGYTVGAGSPLYWVLPGRSAFVTLSMPF